MAKRFIDTNIFSDEWFCELSKEGKIFFIYFITQCDHAGVLKLNKKLCEFQSGLKSLDTVIKELGNSIITLSKESNIYFMPKFIFFQYPGFPKSNVRQQFSALSILEGYGIDTEKINSYLTLKKESTDSYDNDNVNDIDNNKKNVVENFLEIFDAFRTRYPGTKNGNETEFKNFTKKHKDWKQILPLLFPAVENQIAARERKKISGAFVPEWKMLQTWINGRCWEEEIDAPSSSPAPKAKAPDTQSFFQTGNAFVPNTTTTPQSPAQL